ncbi:hypothetical protein [Burkholderia multivorans]|uniref:hypothetical protein n=1 Tax=Burkholderia multivorans TaxID=87883 RepID=UPI000D01C2A6|nr:hypothetical protein [Burkholderia multivorans]PRH50144.1 hypothetical protein C6V05_01385 [Burkholderia multivorans]
MRLRFTGRRAARAHAIAGAAILLHGIVTAAATSSKPLILDTQRGIQDGRGGLVLQTAPLSSEPIVEPAGMRAPAGQTGTSSIPLFIAPYIDVPAAGASRTGSPAAITPRPRPLQP